MSLITRSPATWLPIFFYLLNVVFLNGQTKKQPDDLASRFIKVEKNLDTLLAKLNKMMVQDENRYTMLDSIFRHMNKISNADLEKENKYKTEIEKKSNELEKSRNELKVTKERLQQSQNENEDRIKEERQNLEREIEAIKTEPYTISQSLLKNIINRASKPQSRPANIKMLENFVTYQSKLIEAISWLNKDYDDKAIAQQIKNLKDQKIPDEFTTLSKDKDQILQLLTGYCQNYTEVAKGINDTATSSPTNDENRKELLEEFRYLIDGYPFLEGAFENAMNNKNYRLKVVKCD